MREWAQQGKPDLVVLAEIAERLGVASSTVSRWHRRSMLPEPDLRIGPLELWLWETVRQWGKQRSRFGRRREQPFAPPDIVDAGEIAARLGVDTRSVGNWIRKGAFPRPDYRWDAIDAWLWDTVEAWSRTSLPEVPSVLSQQASGPRLHPAALPSEPARVTVPPSTEVTVAPPRTQDPVGDIDRIHRYFSELARSLTVSTERE